jgi:hypothetical protein
MIFLGAVVITNASIFIFSLGCSDNLIAVYDQKFGVSYLRKIGLAKSMADHGTSTNQAQNILPTCAIGKYHM